MSQCYGSRGGAHGSPPVPLPNNYVIAIPDHPCRSMRLHAAALRRPSGATSELDLSSGSGPSRHSAQIALVPQRDTAKAPRPLGALWYAASGVVTTGGRGFVIRNPCSQGSASHRSRMRLSSPASYQSSEPERESILVSNHSRRSARSFADSFAVRITGALRALCALDQPPGSTSNQLCLSPLVGSCQTSRLPASGLNGVDAGQLTIAFNMMQISTSI